MIKQFSALVIGDNMEEQLAPYNSDLLVDPYFVKRVTKRDKLNFIKIYIRGDKPRKYLKDFEDLYASYGHNFNQGIWRKNERGAWGEYGELNPEGKWSSYTIGQVFNMSFIFLVTLGGKYFPARLKPHGEKNPLYLYADRAQVCEVDWQAMDNEEVKRVTRAYQQYCEYVTKSPMELASRVVKEAWKYNQRIRPGYHSTIHNKYGSVETLIEYYHRKEAASKVHLPVSIRYGKGVTLESCLRARKRFATDVVVLEGQWYELASQDHQHFYNRWIKPLPGDTPLILLQCTLNT